MRRRPTHATMYDFRDLDLMMRIAEEERISSLDLADALGFDKEEGGRSVGIRLGWMRRYGMVAFNDNDRTWSLSQGGRRVASAHLRAPALRTLTQLPDESMVETMAQVLSRVQRGDSLLAHMLRREFLFGTKR